MHEAGNDARWLPPGILTLLLFFSGKLMGVIKLLPAKGTCLLLSSFSGLRHPGVLPALRILEKAIFHKCWALSYFVLLVQNNLRISMTKERKVY